MITINRNKIIAVNATALKSGGALTILRQFLSYIPDERIYYVFINEDVNIDSNGLKNVHLIKLNMTGAIKRVVWDWYGLRRWFKSRSIKPEVVVSLQNTSIVFNKESKNIIYLHQGIPLHPKSWSFLKPKERSLAFYKYIYPFFIFIFTNEKTKFVVQTQWMKKALCAKFKRHADNVYVIKPDLVPVDIDLIQTIDLPYQYTLFYPASSMVFKNHIEIIYALNEIKTSDVDLSLIGLYLTINEDDDEELRKLIIQFNLEKNIHFLGPLNYEDVLRYYKSCTTVLFPSYIESFGMPLLEAAIFGKPIVVIDAEYSREVISGYAGAVFAMKNSPQSWKNAILQSFLFNQQFDSYQPDFEYNWGSFFELIHESD